MTKKEFIELVELRTKIASVFPFVIAFLYSFVLFKQVEYAIVFYRDDLF